MGYVHTTDITQFIPPSMIHKTGGTWTPTLSAGKFYDVRTAADASFDLIVPLLVPGSSLGTQGGKITKVTFFYRIGTAAADDFATVKVYKNLFADGAASTATELDVTIDTGHDAAAERKAVEYHKMSMTIDSPEFIQDDYAYYLQMTIDAAAATVVWVYGAEVEYTLRV
jgi:hypothetical protein